MKNTNTNYQKNCPICCSSFTDMVDEENRIMKCFDCKHVFYEDMGLDARLLPSLESYGLSLNPASGFLTYTEFFPTTI